ncbi:hypothetical protein [Paenibacillus cremeus]|uniref:Uncharacterized protein n=1 Tax=Paenibacillus cremeus TaxID=2163881 RepID=A0A559KCM8_9BACL|nr:hypothetical protein [Paenibacillus cremeus]TVY09880.1 hypothetical protein FPZ49_10940 [Paenibacillus cremeus]
MKFKIGDKVKFNKRGLDIFFKQHEPEHADDIKYYTNRVAVVEQIPSGSQLYLTIVFENGKDFPVSEEEIIQAYESDIPLNYPSEEPVQAGYFEQMGLNIGQLVDKKQLAYGDSVEKSYRLMQIFLEKWRNEDGTYTISDALLKHLLLMVRVIDKQNRIFNNPETDLMDENCYLDITGYGLLGQRMVDKN